MMSQFSDQPMMMTMKKKEMPEEESEQQPDESSSPVLRWKITNYDPETTESPDDIESELQRLKALKSYHLLDIEPQKAYDEVVEYASRIFEGYASIQLVDLERVWCLAGTGPLTPPHELPRRESMCAHVILAKPSPQPPYYTRLNNNNENNNNNNGESANNTSSGSTVVVYEPLVVSDLSKDSRFQQFPTVAGEPFWRFYAGMPLINADGVKLGTLCVFDTKPRHCWDPDQSEMLTQLAGIVISLMEEHRAALPTHQKEDPFTKKNNNDNDNNQQSTSTKDDDNDANNIETKEQEFKKRKIGDDDNNDEGETAQCSTGENWVNAIREDNSNNMVNPHKRQGSSPLEVGIVTTIQIRTFVKILEEVMGEFPKKADLVFVVDNALPEEVLFNDLKVFRSAIALLTSACERTLAGQVCFSVFSRPSPENNNNESSSSDLVLECKDTAPNIPIEWHPYLFEAPGTSNINNNNDDNEKNMDESGNNNDGNDDSTQYSEKANEVGVRGVAQYISTIEGGRYGFAPRSQEDIQNDKNHAILPNTGSVFWFSIPLKVAENS